MEEIGGVGEDERRLIGLFLSTWDAVAAKMVGQQVGDGVDASVRERYAFYAVKSIRTFKAFAALVKDGYLEEAQILTRANFELVTDLMLFSKAPEENAEKLDSWLVASNWGLDSDSDAERAEIDRAQKSFCRKYGFKKFPKHWSGIDRISERAAAVGLQSTYRGPYAGQSDLVHSGTYALACYLDFSNDGVLGLKAGSDWSNASHVVGEGCLWMWYCMYHIEDGLNLQCYELVHALYESFAAYSRSIGM